MTEKEKIGELVHIMLTEYREQKEDEKAYYYQKIKYMHAHDELNDIGIKHDNILNKT